MIVLDLKDVKVGLSDEGLVVFRYENLVACVDEESSTLSIIDGDSSDMDPDTREIPGDKVAQLHLILEYMNVLAKHVEEETEFDSLLEFVSNELEHEDNFVSETTAIH